MGRNTLIHKEFGDYLVRLRERKGWTHQNDVPRFAGKTYPFLTRNVILHLEAGKGQRIAPKLLRALADVYEEPYNNIVVKFVTEQIRAKYGIDVHLIAEVEEQAPEMTDHHARGPHREPAAPVSYADTAVRVSNILDFTDRIRAEALAISSGQIASAGVTASQRDEGRRGQHRSTLGRPKR